MRYCSLDIETTGLDPEVDQILQVGMVIADEQGNVSYETSVLVAHELYIGHPFALSMNAKILHELAMLKAKDFEFGQNGELPRAVKIEDLPAYIQRFLWIAFQQNYVIFAGKNFDRFDLQFLNKANVFDKLPDYENLKFGHGAALDPGIMWYDPAVDTKIPGTAACCRRAGLPEEVTHDALDDARQVVGLVTKYYEKMTRLQKMAGAFNPIPLQT